MRVYDHYVSAARGAIELLGQPEVTLGWEAATRLPLYSVGHLAGHIAGQVGVVAKVFVQGEMTGSAADPVQFIAGGRWIDAQDDDPVHVGIRSSAEQYAGAGPDSLIEQMRRDLEVIETSQHNLAPDSVVQFPWPSQPLTLDDLLTNRLLELVVHIDDLAISLGLDYPYLEPSAMETVGVFLTHLAAARHGWLNVVRLLSRPDRVTEPVTAI